MIYSIEISRLIRSKWRGPWWWSYSRCEDLFEYPNGGGSRRVWHHELIVCGVIIEWETWRRA